MSIEFELKSVYLGWEDVSLSDDLQIVLRTNQTTHRMTGALRELLRFYYYASRGIECNLPIGTGQIIQIDHVDNQLRLQKPPIHILTNSEELTTSLESLLAAVFMEKDQMSDRETRIEKLEYLNGWLADHDAKFDVKGLYQQLSYPC